VAVVVEPYSQCQATHNAEPKNTQRTPRTTNTKQRNAMRQMDT